MNEFLQQFVVESRELVREAGEGLLVLERSTDDGERLDAVFRAFHTLKGGAGIVEFPAMERAVHAAEEVLSDARSGQRPITPASVSACLACLDQVGRWLDRIAEQGALPSGAAEASALVDRFARLGGQAIHTPAAETPDESWAASLVARHPQSAAPSTAVRYRPSGDCFFQGEDPAARIAGLPMLLAQELTPVAPWPSLSELDPFACNLLFMALSGAPAESVRAHLQGALGDVLVVDLRALPETAGVGADGRLRALLDAQLRLLSDVPEGQFAGRVASAGRVAANALRSADHEDEARGVHEAAERALQTRSPGPLRDALAQWLSQRGESDPAVDPVSAPRPAESTLRVDIARIDDLVRLTGELTTAKNALEHTAARARNGDPGSVDELLKARVNEFERLTARLQHAVLALRVLPLRTVLQRLPRVVRDMSSALGKPVTLRIEGDHTEADKTIVDMLFEPLLHALRNAIDHGVESAARRLELKKPLVATLQIRARRVSDRVVVEVEDDGSGIDVQRVRDVALKRRVISKEEIDALSDSQIVDLVFAPGFSTAAAVSEISGRGVGLDAVRTAIQRVGGQVALASRVGQGTTLTFTLPFSVMVTQVLTVEAGAQTYGIPLDALLETLQLPTQSISGVGSAQVIVHRDRTVPLLDLTQELGQEPAPSGRDSATVTVVLGRMGDDTIALRVDQVGDRIEVILKPLEGLLAGLRGVAGTTVLGDGRVLLVLDLGGLLS